MDNTKSEESQWEYNQESLAASQRMHNPDDLRRSGDYPKIEGECKTFFGHGYYTKGLFWFRFNHNNKGFHIKNTKIHPLIFSERMGIKGSGKKIGKWHFKWA